jgi:CDP-diacylglycerol--glycerol-3-phosphate 3-phosphatidyltransferase
MKSFADIIESGKTWAAATLTKKNTPNLLTFGRIAAVVLLLLVMLQVPGYSQLVFWIFLVAAISDYLDGYLARKWKATSQFGAMLDQISDKLLVVLMLVYLIKYDIGGMIILPSLLIILREIYVSGLREVLALKKIPLPVSGAGKWKTASQLVAIGMIQFGVAYNMPNVQTIGGIALLIAAGLAVYSAYQYTRNTLGKLR